MMSLRKTVLPIIRHCATLTRKATAPSVDEQIELECRMQLTAAEFYATFKMLSLSPDVRSLGTVRQRDAIYRMTPEARRRGATSTPREARARLCYHPTLNEPLFAVGKRSMLTADRTEVVFSDALRFRVDAQAETYSDASTLLDAPGATLLYWRAKDRRSFALAAAPHWRIDLTHITKYSDSVDFSDATVLYELEFELTQEALRAADTEEMMAQLERVVRVVLGV